MEADPAQGVCQRGLEQCDFILLRLQTCLHHGRPVWELSAAVCWHVIYREQEGSESKASQTNRNEYFIQLIWAANTKGIDVFVSSAAEMEVWTPQTGVSLNKCPSMIKWTSAAPRQLVFIINHNVEALGREVGRRERSPEEGSKVWSHFIMLKPKSIILFIPINGIKTWQNNCFFPASFQEPQTLDLNKAKYFCKANLWKHNNTQTH